MFCKDVKTLCCPNTSLSILCSNLLYSSLIKVYYIFYLENLTLTTTKPSLLQSITLKEFFLHQLVINWLWLHRADQNNNSNTIKTFILLILNMSEPGRMPGVGEENRRIVNVHYASNEHRPHCVKRVLEV